MASPAPTEVVETLSALCDSPKKILQPTRHLLDVVLHLCGLQLVRRRVNRGELPDGSSDRRATKAQIWLQAMEHCEQLMLLRDLILDDDCAMHLLALVVPQPLLVGGQVRECKSQVIRRAMPMLSWQVHVARRMRGLSSSGCRQPSEF